LRNITALGEHNLRETFRQKKEKNPSLLKVAPPFFKTKKTKNQLHMKLF